MDRKDYQPCGLVQRDQREEPEICCNEPESEVEKGKVLERMLPGQSLE